MSNVHGSFSPKRLCSICCQKFYLQDFKIMKNFLGLVLVTMLVGLQLAQSAPTVSETLLKSLQSTNRKANILLHMAQGSPSKALSSLKLKSFATRSDRLNAVATVLKTEANQAQENLLNFLARAKSPSQTYRVTQLWVSNQVIVRDADFELVKELTARSDISKITEERLISSNELFGVQTNLNKKSIDADEQWGVVTIEAPAVWANGTNGEGVIVATIDSGVSYTHEALMDNYLGGDYAWYAPDDFTETPNDAETHGTHTMGTILGVTNGVGVAPGAKWISCKMCYGGGSTCSEFGLLECGQWTVCPTKYDGSDADCSKAPHLVSNSWGWLESPWYDDVLNAWTASGIIPVFSLGNDGHTCYSGHYPGNSLSVISVGASNIGNELAYFSSIGPNPEGLVRPTVVAPGEDVVSSTSYSDTSYGYMSGTSMACPHVAGVVTLLLSAKPDMTFDEVRILLENGAVHLDPLGRNCEGISDDTYPNNHYGYGLLDALNSYNQLQNS